MEKKLNCIMLIDDNAADNRYHQIVISEKNITDCIKVAKDGAEAIVKLQTGTALPDLIFLDINMPKMNGWEFMEMYKKLGIGNPSEPVILILTTSENPDDQKKASEIAHVKGFIVKPLNEKDLEGIIEKHFPGHVK